LDELADEKAAALAEAKVVHASTKAARAAAIAPAAAAPTTAMITCTICDDDETTPHVSFVPHPVLGTPICAHCFKEWSKVTQWGLVRTPSRDCCSCFLAGRMRMALRRRASGAVTEGS